MIPTQQACTAFRQVNLHLPTPMIRELHSPHLPTVIPDGSTTTAILQHPLAEATRVIVQRVCKCARR
ncbi:hypothetical protein WJX75_008369 [Coccomyxa subellipsoidea]|uniref:Uncharacterized protein n=1 Tax=Coccomyxa subellipsoidea TaxID=248742 RepID=A0ABR2YER3_9CHLO